MSRAQVPDLATQFAHTLEGLCANFVWRDDFAQPLSSATGAAGQVAVALSGGLDSSVLLHLATGWAARQGGARALHVHAFHVHHGLSPHAGAWEAHCRSVSLAAGAAFDTRRVEVKREGEGVEASARKQRYLALGAMCVQHGVPLLLAAHHQDDQAETVLLQLLRGAGPAGLGGMDAWNRAPGLLGDSDLVIARPLLEASRAQLEQYARAHGLAWVDDESNADNRYARNALRNEVMPALCRHFPGFQARIARSAKHARSAQQLLDSLADEDLATCLRTGGHAPDEGMDGACGASGQRPGGVAAVEGGLHIAALQALPRERQQNTVRHWFAMRGVRMPSAAWLDELLEQALSAREGAQLVITHPDCRLRRHKGQLYITPRQAPLRAELEAGDEESAGYAQAFTWQGEDRLAFPDLDGVLHFAPAELGLDPDWLRSQALTIGLRRGGERLKLAQNRPHRSLKHHYQALNVPAWERERMPVVRSASALLFAGGIGMDAERCTVPGGIVLRWEAGTGI